MSLDYEFAPIDVDIISHPKAFAAGVEAMGLWLWGQAHCKLHRTNGHVARMAALGAFAGKRNIMLAKRLVDAGLWLAREDGSWDVWNYEEKAPKLGQSKGAKRTADWRERERERAEVASRVTSRERHCDSHGDVSASTSTSLSSGSDLGSQIASEPPTGVRPRATEPGKPPEWFLTAIEVVAMATGVALPPAESWLRYDGHRETKGMARTPSDAQYWLTGVMVPEARELLRVAARDKDRDAAFREGKRFAKEGPEKPPPPTKAQAQAFAAQLEARLLAQKAAGSR